MATIDELSQELRKNIIDVLLSLPNMTTSKEREALVLSAGLDRNLFARIEFEGTTFKFFANLIDILVQYGQLHDRRYAIVAVLEAARNFVGQDKQEYYDTLIASFEGSMQVDAFMEELRQLKQKILGQVNHLQEIQIIISDKLHSLTGERKQTILNAIASELGVPSESIEVYGLNTGSTVFELGVPADAAKRLYALAESPENIIQQLHITRIVLRRNDYLPTIVKDLQHTYQHTRVEYQRVVFEKERERLRSEPQTVSEEDALQEFGLTDKWQPQSYIENQYEDRGDVIFDDATRLTWQKSGSSDYMRYAYVEEYVKNLNQQRFAGFNDWRLPTIPELMSLLEPEKSSNGLYIDSIFDIPREEEFYWCWSSDKRLIEGGSSSVAWDVYFISGSVSWSNLDSRSDVRAVRS